VLNVYHVLWPPHSSLTHHHSRFLTNVLLFLAGRRPRFVRLHHGTANFDSLSMDGHHYGMEHRCWEEEEWCVCLYTPTPRTLRYAPLCILSYSVHDPSSHTSFLVTAAVLMVYIPAVLKHLESWASEQCAARKAALTDDEAARPDLPLVKAMAWLLG